MPDLKNNLENNPQKKLFLRLFFFCLFFLILAAVPYVLVPFNDKALKTLQRTFPDRNSIAGSSGQNIESFVKSPFYISFLSDQSSYSLYEPVEFRLAVVDKLQGKSQSNLTPYLEVISSQGAPVADILGRPVVPMVYDGKENVYKVQWYAVNPSAGSYRARVIISNQAFNSPLVREVPILIKHFYQPPPLARALTYLGVDSLELTAQRSILSVNNKETNSSEIYTWASFLKAEGFILQGAVSKTYEEGRVWDMAKLSESRSIAQNLKNTGIQAGLTVQMRELDGIEIGKLGYQETKQQENSQTRWDRSVVSLLDRKRILDLREILDTLQKSEGVSFIVLTKAFFGEGFNGEMFPKFLQEFPKERDSNSEAFSLWKNYQMAEYLRSVFQNIGGEKPYIFFFSSKEIEENPEFLDIAFAAGGSYAILDFKGSPQESEAQLENLKNTPQAVHFNRMILSYQVDFNDYLDENMSAPELWASSFLSAARRYGFQGIYINDLYRAMFGRKGSYSAYDWMLSIASLTENWKASHGLKALDIQAVPSALEVTNQFTVEYLIKNQSAKPLSNITFTMLPTVASQESLGNILTVPQLLPGEMLRTNVVFNDIYFTQTIHQKKTHFFALKASYTGAARENGISLLPFRDSSVKSDQGLKERQ